MKSKIKLVFNNVAEIVGNEHLGLLALTDEAQTMELLIPCDKEMKEQLGLRLNHLPITKMLLPEVLWQLVRSFSSDDFVALNHWQHTYIYRIISDGASRHAFQQERYGGVAADKYSR